MPYRTDSTSFPSFETNANDRTSKPNVRNSFSPSPPFQTPAEEAGDNAHISLSQPFDGNETPRDFDTDSTISPW